MELRQLRHFLTAVEKGSFADASERLDPQPGSILASIRALARKLGAELFASGVNGLEPTDAGWALVEPARAALQGIDRARSIVAVPRSLDVMATARRFQHDHPDVDLQVVREGSRPVRFEPLLTTLFPGVTFSGLADAPRCEVGLVTLSGVGLRPPVVAFLDAYRQQRRLSGRGVHDAAGRQLTSVPLSRSA